MFSLVNWLSMCEKTSSQNRCLLFFMERWIAVVVVKDASVEINHFNQFVLSEKQKRRNCRGRASLRKCISVKEFNIRNA